MLERIKRFWKDDSGTAEATSSVVLIAAVGILLGAGMLLYYGGINDFFTSSQTATTKLGTDMSTSMGSLFTGS